VFDLSKFQGGVESLVRSIDSISSIPNRRRRGEAFDEARRLLQAQTEALTRLRQNDATIADEVQARALKQARTVAGISQGSNRAELNNQIDLNRANSDLANSSNTVNAGLTQDVQRTGGEVARGILSTVGEQGRLGVDAQAQAYANRIFPGVKELAEMGIAASAANRDAFIGGAGSPPVIDRLLAYAQSADQANAKAMGPWQARFAGDLLATAIPSLIALKV
jgi:hypothetical protein